VRDYEPAGALTAADGGFAELERIARSSARALAPSGMLALETGVAHHERLASVLREAGYPRSESVADLAGRDRFVLAWR